MEENNPDHSRHLFLFYGLLALLVWLPLPLGSNRDWAWPVMDILAIGILMIWLVKYIAKPYRLPNAARLAFTPLVLMLVWLIFLFFQSVPLAPETLKSLSASSYGLYSYAAGDSLSTSAPISVDRGATLIEFFKSCGYVAIFFLTLVLVDSQIRLKTLARTLVYVGLAESYYGLFNTLLGVEYIWWTPKTDYLGTVTGTFINRNHFAGHLEMVIPFAIGLLLSSRQRFSFDNTLRENLRAVLSFAMDSRGRLLVYTVIMMAALFLTLSRGGNAAFYTALLIAFIVALVSKGKKAAETRYAPMVIVMALLAGLWLGLGKLPERYMASQHESEGRVNAWIISKDIMADYPVFGSGAGTFQYIITFYENGSLNEYYDHPHNDYIEMLTDQGVVGFAFAFSIVLILLIRIIQGYARRHHPFMRSMLFASLVGTVSLLLHAIVDFNFHIPANAAYFYVVMGIGIVSATLTHGLRKREKKREPGLGDTHWEPV